MPSKAVRFITIVIVATIFTIGAIDTWHAVTANSTPHADRIATAELVERGFIEPTLIKTPLNGLYYLRAGAPGTTCHFRLTVVVDGGRASIVTLTDSSVTRYGARFEDVTVDGLRQNPEFAACWDGSRTAPTALPTT